jgi:hypothetical protein
MDAAMFGSLTGIRSRDPQILKHYPVDVTREFSPKKSRSAPKIDQTTSSVSDKFHTSSEMAMKEVQHDPSDMYSLCPSAKQRRIVRFNMYSVFCNDRFSKRRSGTYPVRTEARLQSILAL